MASTRTIVVGVVAAVAVVGAAAYFLTSGDKPLVRIASGSEDVLKVEAAAVHYVEWPEMIVKVNGQEIASKVIETKQREMFTFDVPSDISDVKTVELKIKNDSDCRKTDFTLELGGACTDRTIIVRGLYLNDEKIEGAEASGEGNMSSLLKRSDGGITWKITQ